MASVVSSSVGKAVKEGGNAVRMQINPIGPGGHILPPPLPPPPPTPGHASSPQMTAQRRASIVRRAGGAAIKSTAAKVAEKVKGGDVSLGESDDEGVSPSTGDLGVGVHAGFRGAVDSAMMVEVAAAKLRRRHTHRPSVGATGGGQASSLTQEVDGMLKERGTFSRVVDVVSGDGSTIQKTRLENEIGIAFPEDEAKQKQLRTVIGTVYDFVTCGQNNSAKTLLEMIRFQFATPLLAFLFDGHLPQIIDGLVHGYDTGVDSSDSEAIPEDPYKEEHAAVDRAPQLALISAFAIGTTAFGVWKAYKAVQHAKDKEKFINSTIEAWSGGADGIPKDAPLTDRMRHALVEIDLPAFKSRLAIEGKNEAQQDQAVAEHLLEVWKRRGTKFNAADFVGALCIFGGAISFKLGSIPLTGMNTMFGLGAVMKTGIEKHAPGVVRTTEIDSTSGVQDNQFVSYMQMQNWHTDRIAKSRFVQESPQNMLIRQVIEILKGFAIERDPFIMTPSAMLALAEKAEDPACKTHFRRFADKAYDATIGTVSFTTKMAGYFVTCCKKLTGRGGEVAAQAGAGHGIVSTKSKAEMMEEGKLSKSDRSRAGISPGAIPAIQCTTWADRTAKAPRDLPTSGMAPGK